MTLQFTPRLSRHTPRYPNSIRRYRVQRRLSQERLAVKLELHRSLISLWERGLRLPTVPGLLRMAGELGVVPDALYPDLALLARHKTSVTSSVAA